MRGIGLRGGTFEATQQGEGYHLTLREVRWTEDLAVSGRIDWPGTRGTVRAELHVEAPGASGSLELSWPEGVGDARAQARGTLEGKAIVAEALAP